MPQQHVKDLWETYNLHVENFYNFIKINKELRDLDLKKNYEQKLALCEQAEALVLEPSVVEAFHKLQKLHDEWRETGPVANEYKEALWERFKAASSRINKQHQEHFEALKAEQVRNLELKTGLCEATEELAAQPFTARKEWNRASDRLLEIQKTWKTIGFAPKKDNNRIYERFRAACDRFFEAKRQFYAGVKAEMEHNLQLKTELCEAAESLMQSEEWKKATDELIALQARWKQIGAVSRRHSDAVWKRFRAACDRFFERKSAHFAGVDGEHEENLRRKLALLDEMAAADVRAGGYEVIRDFQRRWGEIGFVPIRQKEAVQKRYKAAVDELFATLRGSERDRSMIVFLSALGEEEQQLAGFGVGADDYLTKPIKMKLLVSRVQAILKRIDADDTPAAPDSAQTGITVDRERHTVLCDGREITLPRKEFALLELLCAAPGRLVSREEIYARIWGSEVVVGDRTIDVHIRKLRQKIGERRIVTVKGMGYKYEP